MSRRSPCPALLGVALLVVTSAMACSSTASASRRPYVPEAFGLEVISRGGPLTVYHHRGRSYVEGRRGDRYAIRVRNDTPRRVEVVVSVDGLDAVDGGPADHRRKRGYLLGPYQSYDIEGFRVSYSAVAAFRFADLADSYAARRGRPHGVGLIEAAFYPERQLRPPPVRPLAPRSGVRKGVGEAPAAERDAPEGAAFGEKRGRGGLVGRCLPPCPPRQGIGTEFGETVGSGVHEADFERAHPRRPARVLTLRYDDRAGLRAKGVRLGDDPWCCAPETRFAPPPSDWRP